MQVGARGLVDTVLEQIEAQLLHHELIKIKLSDECPIDRAEVRDSLQQDLRAEIVQIIGRTLIAYRPRKKDPVIQLP